MRRVIISVLVLGLLSVFLLSQIVQILAAGNLFAWWKFDESSGNASDSSGNSLTLTNNNVTYTTGEVDGAASFDGSSSYFSGTGPNMANSSFSFSVWLYADSIPHDMDYFTLGSSQTTDNQLHLRVYTTGKMRLGFFNDDLDTATGVFTTGTWHNVIITYDASTKARATYLDGVSKATGNANANFVGDTAINIGRRVTSNDEYWQGKVDDLKIYNRVLTSTEITDLAAGGIGPSGPTPTPTATATPAATAGTTAGPPAASTYHPPDCTDETPHGAPNLFQITSIDTHATLYFSPVIATTGYIIDYGRTTSADQYAVSFDDNNTSGVVNYTVNNLAPNTSYYFKVQGKNGCKTGGWSQTLASTIPQNQTTTIPRLYPTPNPTPPHISEGEPQTQPTPHVPEPTPSGYTLHIKVTDDGAPVVGATVELHSKLSTAVTDAYGKAQFTDVEKGEHTLLLSYQSYNGSEKLTVDGQQQDISINITIKLTSTINWILTIIVFLLLFVIFWLLWLLFWKRRKKKQESTD